ncbi:MBL fold metallo-hydrolase [uncultured Erythrobacter sp.]|uniref:MBL fold metallo-hydrolase n=1 Tax=uncultured Erythrobacter sp. TaxID=263913 RepID=UPI0026121182|nr:MBL fold metallo-hydrolase [uncultured Erythrobacter sp.]
MQPRAFLSIAVLAFAAPILSGCGEAPVQASFEQPQEGALAGTATSILNAGVMAEIGPAGDGRAKFLFDPLYDDHFGSFEQLTPELIEAIVTGAPPYDAVDAVFVSHAHGDHFSASMLTRMLAEQPGLRLFAPQQAIDRMREDASWDESFAARTTGVALENGEAWDGVNVEGYSVDAFRSPHSGWPDRHFNTHNITFRVSAPADEGAVGRVMHLGDADPSSEHYAALEGFLSAKRSGLAMVPFWFYQEGDLGGLVDETLNAQMPVAMHVPVRVPAYLRSGELPYFSEVGEVLEIPATR